MYKLYLFWVYLRSKALAGIAMGVTALCVAMMLICVSVMSGFLNKVETAARGLFGDIVVESHGLAGLGSYDELVQQLPTAVPEVEAATPFTLAYGILRVPNTDYRQTVQIAGIRLPERARATDFERGLFVQAGVTDPTFDVPLETLSAAVDTDDLFVQNIIRREQRRQFGILVDRGQLSPGQLHGFNEAMDPSNKLTTDDLSLLYALPKRPESQLSHREIAAVNEARGLIERSEATFRFRIKRNRTIAYTRLLAAKIETLKTSVIKARKQGPSTATVTDLETAAGMLAQAADTARGILDGPSQNATRALKHIRADLADAKDSGPSDETIDALESAVTRLGDFILDGPDHSVILGVGIQGLSYRTPRGETIRHLSPGNKVSLLVLPLGRRINPGIAPTPNLANFTVIDDNRSDVFSIDSKIVYIPFETLQRMSNMGPEYSADEPNRMVEPARCSQVHVKVRDGIDAEADLRVVAAKIQRFWEDEFAPKHNTGTGNVEILTWRQMQAQLIGQWEMQRALVYIIFIIMSAVCVLIIFALMYVIVRQKTRDIGVVKSVGGSGPGIAGVFLAYGGTIGLVGSAAGISAAVVFVDKINVVHDWVSEAFGLTFFNRETFMFEHIPNEVDWMAALWIAIGAVIMGVVGSLLPSILAARMEPVEALRYE